MQAAAAVLVALALAALAVAQCPSPTVPNAELTCSQASVGAGCSVVCHSGFTLAENTLLCTSAGSYTGQASCVAAAPKFSIKTTNDDQGNPTFVVQGPEDSDAVFRLGNKDDVSISDMAQTVGDLDTRTLSLAEKQDVQTGHISSLNSSLDSLEEEIEGLELTRREATGTEQCTETARNRDHDETLLVARVKLLTDQLTLLRSEIEQIEAAAIAKPSTRRRSYLLGEAEYSASALVEKWNAKSTPALDVKDSVVTMYQALGEPVPVVANNPVPDSSLADVVSDLKGKLSQLASNPALTTCHFRNTDDGRDNGEVYRCPFEKTDSNSVLKVTVSANLRVINGVCIWRARVLPAGSTTPEVCSDPQPISAALHDHNDNHHRPSTLRGFCRSLESSGAMSAGSYNLVFDVYREGSADCYTGWQQNNYISVEEYAAGGAQF